MKFKGLFPLIFVGMTSLTNCTKPAFKQAEKEVAQLAEDTRLHTILTDTFSKRLTDETKIINYNKLLKIYNKPVSNYVIIDKKACEARIYDPDGNIVYKTEVVLGKDIGDKRSGGYGVKGVKVRCYTTPGEYLISREGTKNKKDIKLYGNRVLILSGDHTIEQYKKFSTLALHSVPSSPMGKLRKNVFRNGTVKDNRVSFGCINFLVESFDKMREFIKVKNTKVYILPEERGNSLHLEKNKNGNYKFFQTKYRTEKMENR